MFFLRFGYRKRSSQDHTLGRGIINSVVVQGGSLSDDIAASRLAKPQWLAPRPHADGSSNWMQGLSIMATMTRTRGEVMEVGWRPEVGVGVLGGVGGR